MRFRNVFLLGVAFMALGSWAAGADQQSTSSPQVTLTPGASDGQDTLIPGSSSQPSPLVLVPGTSDGFERTGSSAAMRFKFRRLSRDPDMYAQYLAIRNGSVCYTMRTYMVTASERLPENESGFRGYSTCQLASTYNLRSADSQKDPDAKLK